MYFSLHRLWMSIGMRHTTMVALLVFVLHLSSGCNEGSSSSPPIGPDLRGTWGGVYYRTDGGPRTPLTAKVRQDGDGIFISTDRTNGPTGRKLTGTMTPDGRMFLTDAYDGELWSTHYGPARTNQFRIADYVHPPHIQENNPLYVIELRR